MDNTKAPDSSKATCPVAGDDLISPNAGQSTSTKSIPVTTALRLAWHMSEAFDEVQPKDKPAEKPDDGDTEAHLPGWSELTPEERALVLHEQILHDIAVLGIKRDDNLDTLAKTEPTLREAYKTALDGVFRKLHRELSAIDGKLEVALSLGRALADSVNLPHTGKDLKAEFRHWRLANIYEWLNDLHELLPEGAADAVYGSLQNWEHSVDALDPKADIESNLRALHAQGKLWKQLLCGDKRVADQLGADDYISAAQQLITRFGTLTRHFLKNHWIAVTIVIAIVIGLAVLILISGADFNQKLVGFIATALGAFGLSWKLLGSTLGRTLTAIEKPLLAAEMKEAAVLASTILPSRTNSRVATQAKPKR